MTGISRIKKAFLSLMVAFSLGFGSAVAVPAVVFAGSPTDAAVGAACEGVKGSGGNCKNGGAELDKILEAVLNVISIVAGAVAVIMIVVSGFRYITSGGDAQAVSAAKKTLIYAIVGLVVVAMAQAIVQFVLFRVEA